MKLKASFWKLLFYLVSALFFGFIDFFLIRGQINMGLPLALIPLMILISLLIFQLLYHSPKWVCYLIINKPIIALDENTLIENFHHNVKISINNIKTLETKSGMSAWGAPVELRITLSDPNNQIGRRLNIQSFRSSPKTLILYPTTLGIFSGEKKIEQLCELICERNTSIHYRKLALFDSWSK